MTGPLLSISGFSHQRDGGPSADFDFRLTLCAGQAAVVTGPSGSGKTTLLRALAGSAADDGRKIRVRGSIRAWPRLVLQDPEAQLLCSTVAEELAFGPRNLGVSGPALSRRVGSALSLLGIETLQHRSVETLSMGQKYRVVLAAILAMEPDLLLLDEPFSQLDADGCRCLRTVISACKGQGRAVVISAHRADPGDPLWDFHVDLSRKVAGRVQPQIEAPPSSPSAPRARNAVPVLTCDRLEFSPDGTAPVFAGVCLQLQAGLTVHIRGDNGSGKSTLLRCFAGLVPYRAITLRVAGAIGFLPQNADMLLFERSVEREVGFSLGRQVRCRETRRRWLSQTLAWCGLEGLAENSPLQLSHGERHVVALASVLASRPAVALLDEPLTGLDDGLAEAVLTLLDRCARDHDMTIIVATHDGLRRPWGDRRLTLANGGLHAAH